MRYRIKNINLENRKSRYWKRPILVAGQRLRMGGYLIVNEEDLRPIMKHVAFEGDAWGPNHQIYAVALKPKVERAPVEAPTQEASQETDIKARIESINVDTDYPAEEPYETEITEVEETAPEYTEVIVEDAEIEDMEAIAEPLTEVEDAPPIEEAEETVEEIVVEEPAPMEEKAVEEPEIEEEIEEAPKRTRSKRSRKKAETHEPAVEEAEEEPQPIKRGRKNKDDITTIEE